MGRGAEYASKEYYQFDKNHKYLIGSMSDTDKGKQKSVAERMVKTLKHQLVKDSLDVEKTKRKSLKDVQQVFLKKAELYNTYNTQKKVKKNGNHIIKVYNLIYHL